MAKSITIKTGDRKTSVKRQRITLAVEIVTSHRTTSVGTSKTVKKKPSLRTGKSTASGSSLPKSKTAPLQSLALTKKAITKPSAVKNTASTAKKPRVSVKKKKIS